MSDWLLVQDSLRSFEWVTRVSPESFSSKIARKQGFQREIVSDN